MTALQALGLCLLWSVCAMIAAELVLPIARGPALWLAVSTLGALAIWGVVRLLAKLHAFIR